MNKLLTYGMSGLLGLTLASPAMALTGYGPSTQYNGPHWTNHFEGQGPWNGPTYGPGYLNHNGYTYNAHPYHGQNRSQAQNGFSGPNENYGQYGHRPTRNYGAMESNRPGYRRP